MLIIITSAVFIIAFAAYYQSARAQVKREAVAHAERALETTILRIESVLQGVEVAVNNMAWNIEKHLDDPDAMYDLTAQLLRNNSHIVGSAIAFEPYYFAKKGMRFSPYSCYEDGHIVNKQLGTEDYEYHQSAWYKIPKRLNKAYWSEPYFDKGGGELIMSTYSKPLYKDNGEMFAIFTADISLEWFTQLVNSVKPYPNAYNIMVGREGTYLIHHRPERILNQTIFSATAQMKDRSVAEIGHAMVNQERGMATLLNDDILSYVFYAPIERTGWSVGIICPQHEVFAGLDQMNIKVLVIFVVGIILMLICCYHTVRRQTLPLIEFANSAQKISEGDFNTQLPNIKSQDEMKKLRDSFDLMQRSLVVYTEKLKHTIANKERIDSELRIASAIQMDMIPKIFPPFPDRTDVDLYAALIPAKEVGGDLYDFFIEDDKLYFTVGDVSGKGVPASLLMAVTRTLFRNIATHLKRAGSIVSSLNNSIAETNERGMFVTLFLGIIDLRSGRMEYCNAGHNAPILYHNGTGRELDTLTNIPLGVLEAFEYQQQEVQLQPDSKLFVYTDGVTEAENCAQEFFTEERLINLIASTQSNVGVREMVENLLNGVHRHVSGTEQSDDITALCLHYKPTITANKVIVIKNQISELSKLTRFIEELGEELELAPDLVFNLNLALEEAVSNIIKYAYPEESSENIKVEMQNDGKSLIFTLTDSGKPFDPTQIVDADITLSTADRPIGGLGIFIIRQIMNQIEYQRIDEKNILKLKKLL